jgi:hypothetical protein
MLTSEQQKDLALVHSETAKLANKSKFTKQDEVRFTARIEPEIAAHEHHAGSVPRFNSRRSEFRVPDTGAPRR